jgi:MFS superfamily sulfate permease-like transporter
MNPKNTRNIFSNLSSDLPAGLVVFLVALPLCLGIALASGAPLFAGIIAGVVGGTIVAALSGSPLGVSGPAAGLAVIVLTSIQELGAFDIFLFAVVVAGVIQILLGIMKAGVVGYYFPSSVIKGMLTGIGIIIILKQIPHALGYDSDPEGDFAFFQVDGQNTFSELFETLNHISPGALVIALLSLAILIIWDLPKLKTKPFFKVVQGPLLVVVTGIVLGLVFQDMGVFAIGGGQMVSIPTASSMSEFFSQFTLPDFSQWKNPSIYIIGATIAVVASLETLLCVEATDKLDPLKRVTPTNKELVAQGVGNLFSGLIGGLPVTQVIVRSSANIQSGGKSKMSAIVHGFLLLGCAMAIPNVLNLIPLSSLAAVLLMVGYKLAKPALFMQMFRKGAGQYIPFAVTVLGIVFTDLLIGIGLGMAVAIIQILWNNFRTPYHFDASKHVPGERIVIALSEDVSFLNKARILHTLDEIPEGSDVLIDGSMTRSIHPDIVEIFEDFRVHAESMEIKFEVVGLKNNLPASPTKQFTIALDRTAKHYENKSNT